MYNTTVVSRYTFGTKQPVGYLPLHFPDANRLIHQTRTGDSLGISELDLCNVHSMPLHAYLFFRQMHTLAVTVLSCC